MAESYSSQVAWAWLKLAQKKATDFQFEGIILAGGFVKYPIRLSLALARALFALTPWWLWKAMFVVYLAYSGFRLRMPVLLEITCGNLLREEHAGYSSDARASAVDC